jgi:hypothetical protein
MFPGTRTGTVLFKRSQILTACPSDKRTNDIKKGTQYCWSDTDNRRKPQFHVHDICEVGLYDRVNTVYLHYKHPPVIAV